jgi:hypothetical protein
LLLLNLVLVAALGALFAIQQQNHRREHAELQGQLAQKLDELTKNIEEPSWMIYASRNSTR